MRNAELVNLTIGSDETFLKTCKVEDDSTENPRVSASLSGARMLKGEINDGVIYGRSLAPMSLAFSMIRAPSLWTLLLNYQL